MTSVITIKALPNGFSVIINVNNEAVKSQFCPDEASVKAFILKEL